MTNRLSLPDSTPAIAAPATSSAEVRDRLVAELALDLIGPAPGDTVHEREVLPEQPTRWYLGGFLVPRGAEAQTVEAEAADDEAGESEAVDGAPDATDAETEDRPVQARRTWFASSMGLTVLLEPGVAEVAVRVTWGDYTGEAIPDEEGQPRDRTHWHRAPHDASVFVDPRVAVQEIAVPEGNGLVVVARARPVPLALPGARRTVTALSVFLVNRRPAPIETREVDGAAAFQTQLELSCAEGFLDRPDVTGHGHRDRDRRVADLHYHDVVDVAVGHNVGVETLREPGEPCRTVRTTWLPHACVPRMVGHDPEGVPLDMEALAALEPGEEVRLAKLVSDYRAWIGRQAQRKAGLTTERRAVVDELVRGAARAADRIEHGVGLLADPRVLDAFRTMNRAMAAAARKRRPGQAPRWRAFQLAFVLLNLRGIVEPTHAERETVDLLFFPTGGGKTEAYLGLAAFTIVWRRLTRPGRSGCGVAVLMRYTLRLLTLDQLARAATMICALELERRADPARLGDWPFEIGLWVGRAATPNRMGSKGEGDPSTARSRFLAFRSDPKRHPPPVPLRACPWCETAFDRDSFHLHPNSDAPLNLEVRCANRDCAFADRLPIVTVDEPIYRRRPAFIVATIDKFASLPWEPQTSALFGGATHTDADGFSGPGPGARGSSLPSSLPPPDLVIQDELHLISGPLGTMAGLYETAIEALATGEVDGRPVKPKIVASTATVQRAEEQIRALFARTASDLFPPPGPDRRDSFFAQEDSAPERSRLYVGLAAPGRGPKLLFLRSAVTLMAAANTAWSAQAPGPGNPADPYMSTIAYFNALRELGSARRIVEDEVRWRLSRASRRQRVGLPARFVDRKIGEEPSELTSRETIETIERTRQALQRPFPCAEQVDMALATNMISVGLDIQRLALMLVSGQPMTVAEYIQATSRVGRRVSGKADDAPGLVVTLLNLNKPRDRSHYERFAYWHAQFYRGVEAVSVTPFSPRALDRALAAATVALHRHREPGLLNDDDAAKIAQYHAVTQSIATMVEDRRQVVAPESDRVDDAILGLADLWSDIGNEAAQGGMRLTYRTHKKDRRPLLREVLDPDLLDGTDPRARFRAARAMRSVEPEVQLRLLYPTGDLELPEDRT